MKLRFLVLSLLAVWLVMAADYVSYAWASLTVADDPLVRMPGTQPQQVVLEAPRRCLNCHGGYNSSVEPSLRWQAVDLHGETEWHGPVRVASAVRMPFGPSSGLHRWDR